MGRTFKPKISIFHCINSFDGAGPAMTAVVTESADLTFIQMACSSMVKDVFLLRAFEAGADAVLVWVCPEGRCRYVEGNIRAKKRVAWVCHLLDEVGLDGRRLTLHHIDPKDEAAAGPIVTRTLAVLDELGPNPAA